MNTPLYRRGWDKHNDENMATNVFVWLTLSALRFVVDSEQIWSNWSCLSEIWFGQFETCS